MAKNNNDSSQELLPASPKDEESVQQITALVSSVMGGLQPMG